jgi:hypothetical protein
MECVFGMFVHHWLGHSLKARPCQHWHEEVHNFCIDSRLANSTAEEVHNFCIDSRLANSTADKASVPVVTPQKEKQPLGRAMLAGYLSFKQGSSTAKQQAKIFNQKMLHRQCARSGQIF